jgi:RNA polymerase subunit RPABC4/transcription elongation factor Spt4
VVSDFFNTLGSAADAFFSSPAVQALMFGLLAYLFVAYLACIWWVFRDMGERAKHPAWPYLAAGAILAVGPFLFLGPLIIYRVVRPPERLSETYERRLAQEALRAEADQVKICPACERRVQHEWIICPWCRARLARVCPNCEGLVGTDWILCAWCGRDFAQRPEAIAPAQAELPIMSVAAPAAPPPSGTTPIDDLERWWDTDKIQTRHPLEPPTPKEVRHYGDERIVRASSRHVRAPRRSIRG